LVALVPSFLANLLLIAAMVRDWRRHGRLHPAYLIAGACIVVVQIVRIPIARTAAWHDLTTWLLRLNG
jgi:predicted alpha/beta hydrolase